MNAAREGAQLVEGADDLRIRFGEQVVHLGDAVGEPAAGELERQPDPEQPLLRAVVEVALEAAPLCVSCLDDPCARGAHLLELGAQLCLQTRVLEREARGGADRLDELGSSRSAGSWTRAARRVPSCSSSVTARPGSASGSNACPVRVDVALVLGQPEGELEGRVAERARDRVAHLRRSQRRAELHDEIRHGRAVQSRAQQTGEEGERHDADGD